MAQVRVALILKISQTLTKTLTHQNNLFDLLEKPLYILELESYKKTQKANSVSF